MSTELHRRRRKAPKRRGAAPRWLAQLPYAIVLCGVAGGLILCSLNYFRRGSLLVAAALLVAALARVILPVSQVGLLAVRSRFIDVCTLLLLGEMVAFIALSVPPTNTTGMAVVGVFGLLIALALVVSVVRVLLVRRPGRSGGE
ncbi:DUF3017 domain-containing protein [Spirillospora sp. NPDC048911]|uniref:DUF3017 domain-containing protein n=1 Tax=Spirillospora sp. NPDC048911 TaxID=3364527 RepID=UPI003715BC41